MLQDPLVLSVETATPGTYADKTFRKDSQNGNGSLYLSSSHSNTSRDTLTVVRGLPTRVGNFRGVQRGSLKTTKDISVPGYDSSTTLTQPLIFQLSGSIPVGATDEAIQAERRKMRAMLDDDDLFEEHFIKGQV